MFTNVGTSIVNGSCFGHQKNENIDLGFVKKLPYEIILEIFSHFNLSDYVTACSLNKNWNHLVENKLWKNAFYKIAFKNDDWASVFGKDAMENENNKEEFSSLPERVVDEYRKFKKQCPKIKNLKSSLKLVRIPKTLNGGLTLRTIGELAKLHFPDNKVGYDNDPNDSVFLNIMKEFGDKSIDKSGWVLFLEDSLPESLHADRSFQEELIATLPGYQFPNVLARTAYTLAKCLKSKQEALLELHPIADPMGGMPREVTVCEEEILDNPILIMVSPKGISLTNIVASDFFRSGAVAPMRML